MKRLIFVPALLITAILFAGNQNEKKESVVKETLGNHNGSEVFLFTLTNRVGNIVKVTNYGARIVRIDVPDKNGKLDNITSGGETLETIVKGNAFGGATIGRYANRIANGKIVIDGTEYSLPVNNRPNTLHGGPGGWYAKVWNAEIISSGKNPAVKFSYTSPDMEEGFPGTINVEVTYTWSDKNDLIIDYAAVTDKKSVINLTNHAYFNLHGTGKGYIFDHILTLNASAYTPVNSTLIPTGEIRPVKGTPFDFTTPQPMGYKIGETYENVTFNSYDHNYVLDKKAKIAATVYDPVSGRVMEVITDQPGMQFYSGNGAAWKKASGEANQPVNTRSSFALETQHFPDSPNQSAFPSTIINPGDKFKSRTIYRFYVRKDK
jgi:aldose 1-epimerase